MRHSPLLAPLSILASVVIASACTERASPSGPTTDSVHLRDAAFAGATLDELRDRFGVLGGRAGSDSFVDVGRALELPFDSHLQEQALSLARVALPKRSNDRVVFTANREAMRASFRLVDAAAVDVEVRGDAAVYLGALGAADVIVRATPEHVEDFVLLRDKPAREHLAYELDVSDASGLRFVGGSLELLDANGAPRLRVRAPYVVDATRTRSRAALTIEGCDYDTSVAPPWNRPVTRPGARTCTLHVTWSNVRYPAVVDPQWASAGALSAPRILHQSTLLTTGRVLVSAGDAQDAPMWPFSSQTTPILSADLFDPATKTFAAVGSSAFGGDAAAVPLPSGKALLVARDGTKGAQIFDSATGLFAATTGPMMAARAPAASVLVLQSGKVLIAGGYAVTSGGNIVDARVEIFDPATGTFAWAADPKHVLAGAFTEDRPSGVVLGSGKVAFVNIGDVDGRKAAKVYDPKTDSFASYVHATGPADTSFLGPFVSIPGDRVLLLRGTGATATTIFDAAAPGAAFFGPPSFPVAQARELHSATPLPSGRVVIVGGLPAKSVRFSALGTAEVFSPKTQQFTAIATLASARGLHAATLFAPGRLLVTGGGDAAALSSSEILTISADGMTCATDLECENAHCVDGVCCATACAGQCEACDVAGSLGTCKPVAGAPHGKRVSCKGAGTACAGACDGAITSRCAYPAEAVSCSTACLGPLVTPGTCNGAGTCNVGVPRACEGNLRCAGTTCPATCTTNADCIDGFACSPDKACTPAARCASESVSVTADGKLTDCGAFKCDTTGLCKTVCATVDDCASPNACDPTGKCTADASAGDGCSAAPAIGRDRADAWGASSAAAVATGSDRGLRGWGVWFVAALAVVRLRRGLRTQLDRMRNHV